MAVQVGGKPLDDAAPERRVAERDGLRDVLLETGVGVGPHVVGDAGQSGHEPRAEHDVDAAAPGERVGGARHVHLEVPVELGKGRFEGTDRDGRDGALRHGQPVRDAVRRRGLDLVAQRVGQVGRHGPADLLRLARPERDADGAQGLPEFAHARRDRDLEPAFGRVAHGETRSKAVPLAHQRRDPGEDHQVLGRTDRGSCGAEPARSRGRDRHDAEARERVVQRHLDRRAAALVERHATLPQEQRVEQLAGRLLAAASPRGERLQTEVPPPDDVHLGGRGLDAVSAPPHHRLQELPARVRLQLEQPRVDGRYGHLAPARRRLAVGGRYRDRDARLLADLVDLALGRDLHVQLVFFPADVDLR